MKNTEDHFFEHEPKKPALTNTFTQHLDLLSSITTESFYVIDVSQNQICYISPNAFFLCGFSVNDALKDGYGFYTKIIHPEDLPACTVIQNAIMQYLTHADEKRDEIAHFSCTFRLQHAYSLRPRRSLPEMVYCQIKPVWQEDVLRYFICSIRSSAAKKNKSLHLHHKDGSTREKYNFKTGRWKQETIESLTEREKAILMLAGQSKNSKEISNHLFNERNTVCNQKKAIFHKLGVHSMPEAIEYARNHGLIYPKRHDIT